MAISDAFRPLWRAIPALCLVEAGLVVLTFAGATAPARAQVAGQSINMVTGTKWPTGDPFLERQNEPSMAVSSRNPLHLVAGNNDYRTVDLPGIDTDEPTGDAWLGFFTSMDGGNVWQSTLVPGYPQDTSANGIASPLKSFNAGADATVRSGTNGLFYYSGLAFNRTAGGSSAVFMARYVDDNNVQGGNTVRYLGTSIVAAGDSTHFLDKPFIAVDIPRSGSPSCQIPGSGSVPTATIPAGRIYIAYTQFVGDESSNVSSIMFSSSSDCGVTWAAPRQVSGGAQTNQGVTLAIDPGTGNVYMVWRIFKDKTHPDEIAGAALQYQNNTLTQIVQAPISPFDQGTSSVSFRTNAYPTIAVDAASHLYVAWSQRGSTSNKTTGGDARISVIAGLPSYGSGNQIKGMQFAGPVTVDPYNGRGHQIMPAMAFSSGKLTIAWYDFRRNDEISVYTASGGGTYSLMDELPQGVVPQFTYYVNDPAPPFASSVWRQTVDVRAAQAPPGLPPKFNASVSVSQYAFGSPAFDPGTAANLPNDPENIQQLEFNAPNLPIFQIGTTPFVGDYIDVAGPTFVPSLSGQTEQWRFNNRAGDADHTHIVWTDNRNVVQPSDGNWANYTPVASKGGTSIFDPSQASPACVVGQTGTRNQDIYTATLSPGIVMQSKGGFKQLSSTLQREFPVTVENPTSQSLYYRLTIQSQPTGGSASFLQYSGNSPLTTLTVGVPPFSSASRSVFVLSSDPAATVPLTAVQTDVNNNVVPNGLTSNAALNSDVSNPNISNPNISNVEIYNPNISNPNISNPNISNPNISNPNISNPNISNIAFANPNISNPNISNPNISNPNISNPNISNPNISNTAISGEITDATYTVTNSGNTSVSYAVNLLQYQPPPQGITVQLIVSGVYLTPVANACALSVQAHYTPIANIANPSFKTVGSTIQSGPPPALAPTFSLLPGEQALITLRVYDPKATTPAQALQDYNPVANIAPVIGSQGINTNLPQPPPVVSVLAITTSALLPATQGGNYSVTLTASGGSGSYTWSAPPGSLPPNLTLSSAGVLSGSPTTPGTYAVSVQVADSSGQTAQRSLVLVVVSSLAVATANLPAGQFNAPYSSLLAATGGTPPYTWSIAPGGVLPAGMGLNAASGSLLGAPGQAGIWNVPVSVTDATNTAVTATIPLTIGLATAYAGGSNCYMPYPTTPLYPPGASWSINTSSLPNPGQLSLLQGNVLTGCLNAVSTGDYPIVFNASTTTFTLPLHVVGQDQFSNGSFFADSGGVGNLPPSGYQQGVVSPGQNFTYTPGFWGANASNFGGSFLFGFSGGTVQSCLSSGTTNGPISLAAPAQPGRYDILFDGTTQSCQPGMALPGSPAPLIIDSVDAVSTSVTAANATVTNVSLSSTASNVQTQPVVNVLDVIAQTSGTTIPVNVALNYSLYQESACPGCIDQIEVGLNTDAGPQVCAYSAVVTTTPTIGSATVPLNVPNTPGRYYVSVDRSQDFSCKQTTQAWWTGQRSPSAYIAIVDVLAP